MQSFAVSTARASIFWILLVALTSFNVWADGNETLGVPSIPIQSGSGVAVGGTGLNTQPAALNVNVPAGAAIKQALLYWYGRGAVEGHLIDFEDVDLAGAPHLDVGTMTSAGGFDFTCTESIFIIDEAGACFGGCAHNETQTMNTLDSDGNIPGAPITMAGRSGSANSNWPRVLHPIRISLERLRLRSRACLPAAEWFPRPLSWTT